MADEAGTKKRKKSYYINSAKRKRFSLDAGQLIQCHWCNTKTDIK